MYQTVMASAKKQKILFQFWGEENYTKEYNQRKF